ncbi:MAG TPA: iron ABC transporter permease [Pyrinomonadaceae bacterium]|jgi:iron complex transport system permease protein|nr:iron ABC transporter permease [Pyrinomonadaceae bacterium]
MKNPRTLLTFLALAAVVVLAASIRWGAIDFSVTDIFAALRSVLPGGAEPTLDQRIFLELRLPRAVLCLLVGASLGIGGTLMQALFRNPIVEPGLVGTSSGAALGSALFFVLGGVLNIGLSIWSLPLAACFGGIVATYLVFLLARSREGGRASIVMLLLTGLAVNALCLSAIGFLSYIARDPQARSITFWSLGTLSGANWRSVMIVAVSTIGGTAVALRYAKQLNALMIGEEEAVYLGVNVNRLKWIVLSINVVIVAVATAFTGVISFVGLIVPHILRMMLGSDNRYLIIGSAFMGAIVISLADLIARFCLRPAELPIGIVTSAVGVPIFVYLLRRRQYVF